AERAPELVVSVNISPHELNRRLVPNLRAILRDAALPADALCIEITESALLLIVLGWVLA
ncbi:MAG TPA: EAL domain-containing protein, partial [Chromatiales bacterium]|nr:EAL domain-containing protein [Chromatiales bacterium]